MSILPTLDHMDGARRYGVLSVSWLFLAHIASRLFITQPLWFAVATVFVFAIPVALSGGYSSVINQIRTLSYYKVDGVAHRFLSRRWLRTLTWATAALCSTFLMLLQFATYTGIEWIALAIAIPFYRVCYTKIHKILSNELNKRYVTTGLTITWTRWLCPLLMLCIYGLLVWIFGGFATYESLNAALAAKRSALPDQAGSQIVQIALRISTFADGFRSYATGRSSSLGTYLPPLFTAMASYVVFFSACNTLSCFSIHWREMRRVIGPLSDIDVPREIPRERVFITSAVVAFVALFIYLPVFMGIEAWVRGHPVVLETIGVLERRVESIDGTMYSQGTIAKIDLAKSDALGKLKASRATMEGKVDLAFKVMEHNVDGYLDWYYSLPAEYERLYKLLTGKIEDYMEQKLLEQLQQGDANKILMDGLAAATSEYQAVMDEYETLVEKILDENRLADDIKERMVVSTMSMKDIFLLPGHVDAITLTSRISGTAAGSIVGAGLGARVAKNVVGKGVFKSAAEVLAKQVATKTVGRIGGATIGGALGSGIPGPGTMAGGMIGGAIGGVLTDAALLKLEESINRDKFKQEILSAMGEAKADLKHKVFADP